MIKRFKAPALTVAAIAGLVAASPAMADNDWLCTTVTFKDGTGTAVPWVPNCAGSFDPKPVPAPGIDSVEAVNSVLSTRVTGYVPVNFQYKDNLQSPETGSEVPQIDFEAGPGATGSVTFGANLFDPFVLTVKFGQEWSAYLFDVDVLAGTTWTFGTTAISNGLSHGSLFTVGAIPEPSTYALMAAGLAAMGFVARRRRPVAAACG